MLNREDVLKMELLDMQDAMTNDVTEYAATLTTKTVEELKEEEAKLMEEMKKDDEHLQSVTYELKPSVEFDGTVFNADKVADKIVKFLNRLEVEWRATLGIFQAIRFWRKEFVDKVPYAVFDSTLRLLGTLKYKGEIDCKDVLTINNWFTSAHKAYAVDNTWRNYLAALHQAIMQAMEGDEPQEAQEA